MVNVIQSDYPPDEAIEKFLSASTRHTRRVEIYEQDGTTRWVKDTIARLKSGGVNVDYSRDERRTLDLTLDNSDGLILNAAGEFWYDKVIKVFRGVAVEKPAGIPRVGVISDKTAPNDMAAAFRTVLVNANFGDVQVNVLADTTAKVADYDILVALSNTSGGQIAVLTAAYRAGKSVLVFDTDAVAFAAATYNGEVGFSYAPGTVTPAANLSHPVAQGWVPFTLPALGNTTVYDLAGVTGEVLTNIAPVTSVAVAVTTDLTTDLVTLTAHGFVADEPISFPSLTTAAPLVINTTYYVSATSLTANSFKVALTPGGTPIDLTQTGSGTVTRTLSRIAATEDPGSGGRAVVVSGLINTAFFSNAGFMSFIASAISWLNQEKAVDEWETQIGEFMIDRISEPNFPHEIRVTGRDYTKKCMLSKFEEAKNFETGYSLETLISSLASQAGVKKKQLPITGITIGKTFNYERGTSRWDAMKEIASAYNYNLYFSSTGYLVMEKFVDPSSEAPSIYINTGETGQISSYEKATTDARIYNYIVVTGESSDPTVPNVFAIAQNIDPNSPTSIDEIGQRVYTYTSSFMTTTQQCQNVADALLSVHSLEEFELNFETLMLPWLDVGQLIGFVDPSPAPGDPTSFLLTGLNFPLSLGPMSGDARRLTIED